MNERRDDSRGTDGAARRRSARPPTLRQIASARFGRRRAIKGLAAAGAVGFLGQALAGAAFGRAALAAGATSLDFQAIAPGLEEGVSVAPFHRAQVLLRWGDPVLADAPAFDPRAQSAAAQAMQFGFNNDFVAFLPLPRGSEVSDRGLLCVNHEYTAAALMWPEKQRRAPSRARAETEMAAHGHSVVEIARHGRSWEMVAGSRYNRRLTATTEMRLAGPAAGHPRLRTKADPAGRTVAGTLNNCAGGTTPWGTILIAEENFRGYFGGDPANTPEARNHALYGIVGKPRFAWHRYFDRFDVEKQPNEPNRFGWVVEFDPYDPNARPSKRTALGRFQREGATTALAADGRLAVYSGDDHHFGFLFRFVTRGRYDPARRAANGDLLDDGTLYAARFSADGTMRWLKLVFGRDRLVPANGFHGQADVLIEARRAAALAGATPMDRPEDVETNPATGRVYVMLTNNTRRKPGQTDAANPRADNRYGHVLELIPPGAGGEGSSAADHAAQSYRWEMFLLAGDPGDPAHGARPRTGARRKDWLAAPDNCAFDPKGRLWIATDRGRLQTETGIPDGIYACETTGPGRAEARMFFACPRGAEACGPAFTPDGKTLFVAVQHPGGGSRFEAPSTRWPDFDPSVPPRPSVVAITREDGGPIGG